jgi:hypothetical protein
VRVELHHEYSVLGWFWVTDVWPERAVVVVGEEMRTITPTYWKYRLERITTGSGPCWMEPDGCPPVVLSQELPPPRCCSSCGQVSKHNFSLVDGWTCLQYDCDQFFKFSHNSAPSLGLVGYHPAFVHGQGVYEGPTPGPLVEYADTSLGRRSEMEFGTELSCRSGGVCPRCRCCSGRKHWDKFVCENPTCGYEYHVPLRAVPLDIILGENAEFRQGGRKSWAHERLKYKLVGAIAGHTFEQWLVPGPADEIIGSITILRCWDATRSAPNGPNGLWVMIQGEDHNLSRNAVRHAGRKLDVDVLVSVHKTS